MLLGRGLSVTSGDMLLLVSKVVFNMFIENHRQNTETCDRKELERDLQQGKPTSPGVVKAPSQQTRKGLGEWGPRLAEPGLEPASKCVLRKR